MAGSVDDGELSASVANSGHGAGEAPGGGQFVEAASSTAPQQQDPKHNDKEGKQKQKRVRTTDFGPEQVAALEKAFAQQSNPKLPERTQLARETGCPLQGVTSWFQNRRARERRKTQRALKSSKSDLNAESMEPNTLGSSPAAGTPNDDDTPDKEPEKPLAAAKKPDTKALSQLQPAPDIPSSSPPPRKTASPHVPRELVEFIETQQSNASTIPPPISHVEPDPVLAPHRSVPEFFTASPALTPSLSGDSSPSPMLTEAPRTHMATDFVMQPTPSEEADQDYQFEALLAQCLNNPSSAIPKSEHEEWGGADLGQYLLFGAHSVDQIMCEPQSYLHT